VTAEVVVMSEAEELVANGSRSLRGKPWIDRTHCGRGHEYTPENIIWRKHGARRCRICHREADRRWYAERGAALRKARRLQLATAVANPEKGTS
jgi:hypothetical protein